jgi:hypothetical protein
MILDFSSPGAMKVDMKYYIDSMIEDFPYPIKSITTAPWTAKLMKVDTESKDLDAEKKAIFHTFTMKAMFLCKEQDRMLVRELDFSLDVLKSPTKEIGRSY